MSVKVPICSTEQFRGSFVPTAVKSLNETRVGAARTTGAYGLSNS